MVDLEVTVLLDADLGLSTSVTLAYGATIRDVKAELCSSDPTGQTRIEDIALVDSASGELLDDGRVLSEDLAQRLKLGLLGAADCEAAPESEEQLQQWPAPTHEVVAAEAAPTAALAAEPSAVEAAAASPAEPVPFEASAVAAPKRKAASSAPPDVGTLLAHAAVAMAKESDSDAANSAFGALGGALRFKSLRPQLLLARGLLWWRWSRLGRAASDLTEAKRLGAAGAGAALLALQICLGRWEEARSAADELEEQERSSEAPAVDDASSEGTYEVVHEFVTLRNEPSTKGKIVGTLKRGAQVIGVPWPASQEPWIRLSPQKLPPPAPGAPAKEIAAGDSVFALTDASAIPSLKLGVLLERAGGPRRVDLKALRGQVEHFLTAAESFNLIFFPQIAPMAKGFEEAFPGMRQLDVQVPGPGGNQLGLRLLLQCSPDGKPKTDRPLVLVFHGEDQNVSHWLDNEQMGPLREANASVIVADYRGYGFSSGTPSVAWLGVDADAVCDVLPKVFTDRGQPWPWPGRLFLLGVQLGSRPATYLAGTRGDFFDGGVVLDSAWCGSRAPGAPPPPDGKKHTALASMGCNAVGDNRFGTKEMAVSLAELGRTSGQLVAQAGFASVAHACFALDNEDFVRSYDGRLLILHGSEDHQIPAGHAQRLCDAAESATRKLVVVRGKMQDSLRGCREYNDALKKFLAGS